METFRKILLDTNFLMGCAQFKVDIFSEIERICHFNYRLYVLDKTIDELNNIIKNQRGKQKDAAKIALQLLKIKNVEEIKDNSEKYADEAILEHAKKGWLVATQDKDLKRKLINQGISVIVIRQKKVLTIANDKGFF